MEEEDAGGAAASVGLLVPALVRELTVVVPGRIGFWVVVMTWVTGGRFVMVTTEVTSMVVLALRTLQEGE